MKNLKLAVILFPMVAYIILLALSLWDYFNGKDISNMTVFTLLMLYLWSRENDRKKLS